jgi:hypothetical protein
MCFKSKARQAISVGAWTEAPSLKAEAGAMAWHFIAATGKFGLIERE